MVVLAFQTGSFNLIIKSFPETRKGRLIVNMSEWILILRIPQIRF